MKLNKKGFVATSVLYSLAAIIAVVIFLMIANMRTMRDINRDTSNKIKDDLNCIDNGGRPEISFANLNSYRVENSNYYRIKLGLNLSIPNLVKCSDEFSCTYIYKGNEKEIENINDIEERGTYEISCTAFPSIGNELMKSATEKINVIIY